jgi:hypothetical protein
MGTTSFVRPTRSILVSIVKSSALDNDLVLGKGFASLGGYPFHVVSRQFERQRWREAGWGCALQWACLEGSGQIIEQCANVAPNVHHTICCFWWISEIATKLFQGDDEQPTCVTPEQHNNRRATLLQDHVCPPGTMPPATPSCFGSPAIWNRMFVHPWGKR